MPKFKSLLSTRLGQLLAAGTVVVLAGAAGGIAYFNTYTKEAELLRADPDILPQQRNLMSFAVAQGESVYKKNCAACHGDNAKGDSSRGVPNLGDNDWLYGVGRVTDIERTIKFGIRAQDARGHHEADMPAFAQAVPYPREKEMPPLAPADVRDVVEYLFMTQKRPADAAAAERGLKIFNGRGGCWDCHGDDARGDEAIGSSNLTDNIWIYGNGSRADITRSIEEGRQGVHPAWVNRLSAANILEVSLYVYSLSHPVGKTVQ